MIAPPLRDLWKRRWYGLAMRHIRIARRLAADGFADAALFHTIHAYECVLSALIAAKGWVVPGGKAKPPFLGPNGPAKSGSSHVARRQLFAQCADKAAPY